MRGKKGKKHTDPADPPRRRANKKRGHGTWDGDRPPVLGIVGRDSGELRLTVLHHSSRAEIEPEVLQATRPKTTVNTDEWKAYGHLTEKDRLHATVCHKPGQREWARDDDGDGIREVHCNTSEGIWTGLRNFLRTFRGVNKVYLAQYAAIFQWRHNIKAIQDQLIRLMLAGGANTDYST